MNLPERTNTADVSGRSIVLIGAATAFALAMTSSQVQAAVALLVGIPAVLIALVDMSWIPSVRMARLIAGFPTILFAITWLAKPVAPQIPFEPSWFNELGGIIWLSLGIAVIFGGDAITRRTQQVIVASVVVATLLLGSILIVRAGSQGLDVKFLHEAAAEAVANRDDPYSDSVAVPDGSTQAEDGDMIVGYPYPPATLLPYAVAEWTLDDPRWASLGAWTAFIAVLGYLALRSRTPVPAIGGLTLAASVPGWPLVILAAWSEPWTLAVLALSAVLWRQKAVISGLFWGLAMSTKQYFAGLAPLILLWTPDRPRTRSFAVIAGLAIGLAPLLLWNLGNELDALILFHGSRPVRLDGTSLPALVSYFGGGLTLPSWAPLAMSFAVSSLLARRVTGPVTALIVTSLTLTGAFITGSQAFANYWLLICGSLVLAANLATEAEPRVRHS